MKKAIVGAFVIALAAVAGADVCYNEATQRCYPPIFGGECSAGDVLVAECPVVQPEPTPTAVVEPTPVPTPTPPPDEGNWLDSIAIKLTASRLAKILAGLIAMAGTIQIIKKFLGQIAQWQWLLKLVPPLAVIVKFLSEGIGPLILNAALTLTVVLPPLISDGAFSIRDALTLVGVFFGNIGAFMGIKATFESWSGKTQ